MRIRGADFFSFLGLSDGVPDVLGWAGAASPFFEAGGHPEDRADADDLPLLRGAPFAQGLHCRRTAGSHRCFSLRDAIGGHAKRPGKILWNSTSVYK